MYKLRCEWDYGQDNVVFISEDKAIEWFNNQDLEPGETYETLYADGLVGIEEYKVI